MGLGFVNWRSLYIFRMDYIRILCCLGNANFFRMLWYYTIYNTSNRKLATATKPHEAAKSYLNTSTVNYRRKWQRLLTAELIMGGSFVHLVLWSSVTWLDCKMNFTYQFDYWYVLITKFDHRLFIACHSAFRHHIPAYLEV